MKQVVSDETEADLFAVSRVGKDSAIGFLTHLLETRPEGEGWNAVGSREFELRIAAIRALPA